MEAVLREQLSSNVFMYRFDPVVLQSLLEIARIFCSRCFLGEFDVTSEHEPSRPLNTYHELYGYIASCFKDSFQRRHGRAAWTRGETVFETVMVPT